MTPLQAQFVLCTMPPQEKGRPSSRAARQREAKIYWDSLTPQQEAWALRKMRFHEFGSRNPKSFTA